MSLKNLKFYTLILFSLVLISFCPKAKAQTPCSPEPCIEIDIPNNQTGTNGSTVNIPVTLIYRYTQQPETIVAPPGTSTFDPNRIVAFSFAVNFNPAVLQPDFAVSGGIDQAGTLTGGTGINGGWSCTPDINTAGRLGVACATGQAGIRPTPGAINNLINLVFTVVGQPAPAASCCTNLTFSQVAGEAPRFQNRSGATVPTTATGGSFFLAGATAASVNLAGRVLTAEGRGLRGAQVRLTFPDGTTRTVMTSSFGYYRFADLPAGQTVTVQVLSKKYGYQSHTVNLTGDTSEINFVAER